MGQRREICIAPELGWFFSDYSVFLASSRFKPSTVLVPVTTMPPALNYESLPGLVCSKFTSVNIGHAGRGRCPSARIIFYNCRGAQVNKPRWLNWLPLSSSAAPQHLWVRGTRVSQGAAAPKMRHFPHPFLLAGFCVQNYFILCLDKHMSQSNKELQ